MPLIKKTFRPPNFETPVEYFRTAITPNKAFFVRYHLAAIPQVSAKDWVLSIGGESAERELKLGLAELKKEFKQATVTAVCHAIDKTPDFVKSLPLDVALRDETLVAFEMNGAPLPHWNGFPARLVVPGWTGTYWVKQLTSVKLVSQPEKNFWMSTAYRLPRGRFRTPTFQSQLYSPNEPITTMVVNSLVTSLKSGQQLPRGKPIAVRGVAWDGGSGIERVEVSADLGASWQRARLGKDLGGYSFREFALDLAARETGSMVIMARATSKTGETQVSELIHNPAGYHHNVIQRIYVEVV